MRWKDFDNIDTADFCGVAEVCAVPNHVKDLLAAAVRRRQ